MLSEEIRNFSRDSVLRKISLNPVSKLRRPFSRPPRDEEVVWFVLEEDAHDRSAGWKESMIL